MAFIVWDIAPRSPLQLLRDLGRGLRRPGTLLRGLITFVAGLLLLLGSITILMPLLLPEHVLALLVTWAMLTGLLVDQIVGPDLYGRRGARARSNGDPPAP